MGRRSVVVTLDLSRLCTTDTIFAADLDLRDRSILSCQTTMACFRTRLGPNGRETSTGHKYVSASTYASAGFKAAPPCAARLDTECGRTRVRCCPSYPWYPQRPVCFVQRTLHQRIKVARAQDQRSGNDRLSVSRACMTGGCVYFHS